MNPTMTTRLGRRCPAGANRTATSLLIGLLAALASTSASAQTPQQTAQQAYLKASNTGSDDFFGNAVAVSGDTVVVGARGESSSATGVNGNQNDNSLGSAGAAYVFVRSAGVWTQQAYLKASNPEFADHFGASIAISGDTLVVGAPYKTANAGAAYVFVRTGTNWSQQAYLRASNTGPNDEFGGAVAISGSTILVGAPGEASNATGVNGNQSDNSAPNSGAAYVFTRSGTTWTQQAYLKASNSQAGDFFGNAVALSGDTVVIGAPYESSSATGINGNQSDNSALGSGAAYVFVRNGAIWSQQAYLKASNPNANDAFGRAVAISGDTAVVGADAESSGASGVNGDQTNNDAPGSGAAYVFVRSGTAWSQQAYLKPSFDFLYGGNFGAAAAISGERVLIGAWRSDDAYVFTRNGTTWAPEAYLKAYSAEVDKFGGSVGLSGDLVVVGAPEEDSQTVGVDGAQCDNNSRDSGAAYAFDLNATNNPPAPHIVVEQPSGTARTADDAVVDFGSVYIGNGIQLTFTVRNSGRADLTNVAVTLTGPNAGQFMVTATPAAILAAPCGSTFFNIRFSPVAAGTNTATLHITSNDPDASLFDLNLIGTALKATPTQVAQQAYAKASNTSAGDNFGTSVAISGDTMVVGAPYEDSNATAANGNQTNNTATDSGAAYVLVRDGTNWIQQAYLKASYTEAGDDRFGYKVAIDGDTIVITAVGEDSNATGVNGNQTNNLSDSSGAAYVFVRSGTNWSQQAYLKASNTGPLDYFGAAVAISGSTVIVGADREDSSATGVNGNQSNNSAPDSGAAYVFVRNGTNWTQQAYLKASNTRSGDQFGWSVAVSANTAVVGAKAEDSRATGVNGNPLLGATDSGAAYVFMRNGTDWSQQAYLKASNTKASYFFGESVAVSGDTAVVGSDGESSNATGVNGNQTNALASHSGAAYVFVRNGTNWSQQAYLKAANTAPDSYFGWAVAISGGTVVVGADRESGGSISGAGAACVFLRSGTNWAQQAYLKASNIGFSDNFAKSVAVWGDTVAVGAPYEDSNASGVNGNPTDNSATDSGATYVFSGFGLRHPVTFGPVGNGGYVVRFEAVPTFSYRLERAPSVEGPWGSIATNTAPASGLVDLQDSTPPPGQAFYRTVTP
jgi:uncharacterized repeat protein (TIGR01451 family)